MGDILRILPPQLVVLVWQRHPVRRLGPSQAMVGLKRVVDLPKLDQELDSGWVLTMRAEVWAPGRQELLAALPEMKLVYLLHGLVWWGRQLK